MVKWIFKRNNLKIKRVRTANWTQRQELYPYDKLECFEQLNYDVKIITDLSTDTNKKLWNTYLKALNAEFDTIPLWAKHLLMVGIITGTQKGFIQG